MPLNPNGKIDKPALPFPDTAEAASAPRAKTGKATPKLSSTEAAISAIWGDLLPSPPTVIPIDESFFDLGGHSILATRLIFELRKKFVVEAPLGLVFERPTIKELAKAIDTLRDPHFGLAQDVATKVPSIPGVANGSSTSAISPENYGADLDKLINQLARKYPPPKWTKADGLVVFLTGATGFLGAYILRDLLNRPNLVAKVICLVRAKSAPEAMNRLRESGTDRGIWDEHWVSSGRLLAFRGDLSAPRYALSETEWENLAETADVILHNGAMVSIVHLWLHIL
jgi:L-aminoadipate-semialdehyde dehydrogenase